MEGTPCVVRVIHLRTEHLGPEQLLVAAKVEFDQSLDIPGLARAIDEVEVAVRSQVPEAALIYLEPDITRSKN
jgi:divalent metal cation (Fe/Co/Zn/Cd) transporter